MLKLQCLKFDPHRAILVCSDRMVFFFGENIVGVEITYFGESPTPGISKAHNVKENMYDIIRMDHCFIEEI